MERKRLATNAKIAIVNRGEAAVRFIRATKEYNTLHGTDFESVALYIDAESDALFVKEADHSYNLSDFDLYDKLTGSPYLNAEFMLSVIKTIGCDAVWVGWGFLAEDPAFAQLLENNDIILIGPTAEAMEMLGDKIKAKELADRTKVPTTPWSGRPLEGLEDAKEIAKKIGYPVILKSANGGGGRGIRKILREEDLEQGLKSVTDEIYRFFGNRIIFMEALVVRGRHLEVQCVADYHGNVETFGVRDCSVQRNNQKIIEETPPAHMKTETIHELEAASSRLLKASQYHGAGTVEYLYDLDRNQSFFMEVNTRLQVEHPISEELYHTDLVQLQLHVARGENLSQFQKEAPIGHVIEVRLNAEDPDNRFAPTPGKIKRYLPPQLPGIRLDAGIEWGSTIPKEFDSMIAKIIARGPDRKSAIAKLTRALRELQIEIENGTTNQGFLLELLATEEVRAGGVQTNFVESYLEKADFQLKSDWDIAVIAGAIYQYEQKFENDFENFVEKIRRFSLPRNMPHQGSELPIHHQGHDYAFYIRSMGNNVFHIETDNKQLVAEYVNWGHEIILKTNRKKYKLQIVPRANSLQCEIDGVPYVIPLESGGTISAPSPSVVLTVNVEPGQEVKQGDLLLTLEAMKMEMTVSAPQDGKVKNIMVRSGEQVAAGQKLVDIEAKADETVKDKGPVSARLSFHNLEVGEGREILSSLDDQWNYLAREFRAVFTGFDYTQPVGGILAKLESFVEEQPHFKRAFGQLIIDACKAHTAIEKLFRDRQESLSGARESEFDECLMHYFLRREDREKGLPESFLVRLEAAIKLYPWAELDNYNDTTLALFHIYKSNANQADKVELARLSLFAFQKLYPDHPDICSVEELSLILNEMIQTAGNHWVLVDAAIHTRYNLVDRKRQEESRAGRRELIANLLNSVLDREDAATSENEVIESGHQIISHLVSLAPEAEAKRKKILELVGKRFNRDRKFQEHEFINSGEDLMYAIQTSKHGETFTTLVKILNEDQFFKPLTWLDTSLEKLSQKNRELILLVRRNPKTPELKFINHLEQNPLKASLCCLGLYNEDQYIYRSFETTDDGQWQESVRRRYFSPLRYRELRLHRLSNFDVELVYHSQFVHVMKLEAKDNTKDQRIFAFVEIPETNIELNDSQEIQRIGNFEYGILEAIQAIREQQARQKRLYFWNRIVVHIGQTHPLKLDQIGEYPKTISNMIAGLGLEKITIYSKIAGRQRKAIDAEVMVENFATNYSIRGRLPSREPLKSLDPYTSKVVRSLRRASPYPYEVISMLTNASSDDFPAGRFEEFDIQFDVNGHQKTVSVEGRPYGNNISNIVFGKIYNRGSQNMEFQRVIILGDPSRDLGSLAEDECRRVIAAIDLAETDQIPVEWIPVSSGAAIDMETGTENLDWTARVLRRVIEFTQLGGEINIIVPGINVGAQSYWNAEATMLQHTRGLLIMTEEGTMVLTGKKALDFSGSVSAEDNIGIGGAEKIMSPNGQAQFRVKDLAEAYRLLFRHYHIAYSSPQIPYGKIRESRDEIERDVCEFPYQDPLNQGFKSIGDILGKGNLERKKPFDMRQVMTALRDQDSDYIERWKHMRDAETAIVWESQVGGYSVGMIGIESRPLKRFGDIPNDGPDSWTGGTLYPLSSKKVSRAINAFSDRLPVVVLANLSGFDGSPESLRKLQLEYGAEIGRAVVNFKGPLIFVVVARYHGGAYVVFSKTLNPNMKVVAIENTFASVIGGAPAAAVVFPRQVLKNTFSDPQIVSAQEKLRNGQLEKAEYDELFQRVHLEHQAKLAQKFEKIHSVERALKVGSIDEIISAQRLRPYIVQTLETEVERFLNERSVIQ
ncbi:carboxyl transferase domain-containing protein [Pseudobacteriovorax antillogorgiicola]|uniref:Acetyl/propionyl-CoA carboxylase, alpha subunit n=1 Tax=Pseudobacteriovorax antillogorgiicola TaxID=1513793 RepID=A0A1Y6CDZ5_9BACT|nr:carboxyl transferase domain-containing protein [Pseudobacteriovorax antillogorgiicola]TCS48330.1 acetyl/propionyl-CoA carboxylase alpha subunit [Pseudobacteriovorax antillogorgiicola]SMF56488.1 Acetyl/propionyl-CoA carboxylase, alpha subunit [Pseudobacteriovorax antillogorgiicola]